MVRVRYVNMFPRIYQWRLLESPSTRLADIAVVKRRDVPGTIFVAILFIVDTAPFYATRAYERFSEFP